MQDYMDGMEICIGEMQEGMWAFTARIQGKKQGGIQARTGKMQVCMEGMLENLRVCEGEKEKCWFAEERCRKRCRKGCRFIWEG